MEAVFFLSREGVRIQYLLNAASEIQHLTIEKAMAGFRVCNATDVLFTEMDRDLNSISHLVLSSSLFHFQA